MYMYKTIFIVQVQIYSSARLLFLYVVHAKTNAKHRDQINLRTWVSRYIVHSWLARVGRRQARSLQNRLYGYQQVKTAPFTPWNASRMPEELSFTCCLERGLAGFSNSFVALNCLFSFGNIAAKADLWRYLALWEYGGIYTDLDNLPGERFNETTIAPDTDAFFLQEQGGWLSQYFFAVAPKHPIMFLAVHDVMRGKCFWGTKQPCVCSNSTTTAHLY